MTTATTEHWQREGYEQTRHAKRRESAIERTQREEAARVDAVVQAARERGDRMPDLTVTVKRVDPESIRPPGWKPIERAAGQPKPRQKIAILELLERDGARQQRTIGKALGLSAARVSALVNELVRDGEVTAYDSDEGKVVQRIEDVLQPERLEVEVPPRPDPEPEPAVEPDPEPKEEAVGPWGKRECALGDECVAESRMFEPVGPNQRYHPQCAEKAKNRRKNAKRKAARAARGRAPKTAAPAANGGNSGAELRARYHELLFSLAEAPDAPNDILERLERACTEPASVERYLDMLVSTGRQARLLDIAERSPEPAVLDRLEQLV